MYCIQCGVRLADSQARCPLCGSGPEELPALAGQHRLQSSRLPPLYPPDRYPPLPLKPRAVNASILFLFLIPLLVTLFVDLQTDGRLGWSVYAVGALVLAYLVFALPLWLRRPNPIVFVPCDFAAAALYLLLIEGMTGGRWFLPFALPLTLCAGCLATALTVLLRCLRRGKLFVLGGFLMALGGLVLLTEALVAACFPPAFRGWSVYPLIVLLLLGGLLIFLGISRSAREKMERRFFF